MVDRPDIIGEKIAEGALIGALMEKSDGLIHCENLTEQDFLSPMAGRAYKAILDLWREKKQVNLATLCLHDRELATWLPAIDPGFSSQIPEYVQGITESARRRRIRNTLQKMEQQVMKVESASTISALSDLCERETIGERNGKISTGITRLKAQAFACQEAGGEFGISTGIEFLEQEMIRMQRGHVWGIGGLTSHGKTMLMTSILTSQLLRGRSRQLVISTEMTTEQMVARILACHSGINSSVFFSGGCVPQKRVAFDAAYDWLSERQLTIYDEIYEWPEIESVVRSAALRDGVDIVWIDYVQNCVVPNARNEYEAQSRFAKGLQRLAKRCKCTVVYLSQLPNSFLNGDHGEAQFKGAGEWAAVADVAIFIKKSKTEKGVVEVEVRKNRHGKLASGLMRFVDGWTRLE